MSEWTDHVARWKDCQACPLAKQRFRICLGRGQVPCDVLFIGEAPGLSEDVAGVPFAPGAPAGRLLNQIVDRALGDFCVCPHEDCTEGPFVSNHRPGEMTCCPSCGRQQEPHPIRCAFTNLVCCFPREAKARGDNEPEYDEIAACRPRLIEFVRLARPRLVVLVGSLAKQSIYGAAMFRGDGEDAQPEWIPEGRYLEFVDIIHPAAILAHMQSMAQKQNAVIRATVAIRSAVEDALCRTPNKQPIMPEKIHAKVKPHDVRHDYEQWDDADIPF